MHILEPIIGDKQRDLSDVGREAMHAGYMLRAATPADVARVFVAQASIATLQELIAIGEAANDEKDSRLGGEVAVHVSELSRQPEHPFTAADPDFSGANVDVIHRLFVTLCEADGSAEKVRRRLARLDAEIARQEQAGGDPTHSRGSAGTLLFVVGDLNLSALLDPLQTTDAADTRNCAPQAGTA